MAEPIKAALHVEAHRLMTQDVLTEAKAINLNVHQNYRPAMTLTEAINEHVSNWMDQVVTQTRLLNQIGIQGNLLITREASKKLGESRIVAKFGPSYFKLGSIQRHKEEGICFRNRESVILPSALALGVTSKAGEPESIGMHGEGFKTAVNRLLRDGYHVEYLTHAERWWFEHRNQFLHANRYKNTRKPYDTVIRISHEEENVLKIWDDDRFLCLADWYVQRAERAAHMFTLPGEGLEIEVLLDAKYHGELYANGILVNSEGEDFTGPYGFNFRGKAMTPGRDRKTLSRAQLFNAFNNVLRRLSKTNMDRAYEMLKEGTFFYDFIMIARKRKQLWIGHFLEKINRQGVYPCRDEKDAALMLRWFQQRSGVVSVNHAALLIHGAWFLPAKLERVRRFRGLGPCAAPKEAALIQRMVKIIQPAECAVKYVQSAWKLPVCWDKDNAAVYVNLAACTVPGEDLMRTVITVLMLNDPTNPDFPEQIRKNKLLCDVLVEKAPAKKRAAAVVVLDAVPAKRQRDILCSGTCSFHCH